MNEELRSEPRCLASDGEGASVDLGDSLQEGSDLSDVETVPVTPAVVSVTFNNNPEMGILL